MAYLRLVRTGWRVGSVLRINELILAILANNVLFILQLIKSFACVAILYLLQVLIGLALHPGAFRVVARMALKYTIRLYMVVRWSDVSTTTIARFGGLIASFLCCRWIHNCVESGFIIVKDGLLLFNESQQFGVVLGSICGVVGLRSNNPFGVSGSRISTLAIFTFPFAPRITGGLWGWVSWVHLRCIAS